jgi:hypothetical protein
VHRRSQVGHDDRPRELARGERRHAAQHLAVAQMDVPVVGPADVSVCDVVVCDVTAAP